MEASAGNAVVQALLDEQAALRRVATLVATAGEPARVFPIVTEEVGRLLGAQTANMVRYRHDDTADVIGQWNEPDMPSMPPDAELWDQAWVGISFLLLLVIAGLGSTVLREGEEALDGHGRRR